MIGMCYYCDETDDLRPYGPDGADICFRCMKEDPKREEEAERQFNKIAEAIHGPIVIGFPDGPVSMAKGLNCWRRKRV